MSDDHDDRPSIAELQRLIARGGALKTFAAAILEIAAAALTWQDDPLELLNHKALVAALAKVRR